MLTPADGRLYRVYGDHPHNNDGKHLTSSTLRSIKSKTISTDGSLSLIGEGTFGWMLTDAQGKKLVTGSGHVDGPADQASSTRSELHGFAAPLEYIHQVTEPDHDHQKYMGSGAPR
jgi:hypothetical protein